jgi:hydroxymethylbilane synthase
VLRGDSSWVDDRESNATIATSSLRRKAQWLHRFPRHRIENLRGNVGTRLKKLADSDWQGAIFARAGLERLGEMPANSLSLDWMLPAPAQGAILVTCREEDEAMRQACSPLNDPSTAACVNIERAFLSIMMGGCSTPVGALATLRDGQVHFRGNVCSLDGVTCLSVERTGPASADLGRESGEALLAQGAGALIQKLPHD